MKIPMLAISMRSGWFLCCCGVALLQGCSSRPNATPAFRPVVAPSDAGDDGSPDALAPIANRSEPVVAVKGKWLWGERRAAWIEDDRLTPIDLPSGRILPEVRGATDRASFDPTGRYLLRINGREGPVFFDLESSAPIRFDGAKAASVLDGGLEWSGGGRIAFVEKEDHGILMFDLQRRSVHALASCMVGEALEGGVHCVNVDSNASVLVRNREHSFEIRSVAAPAQATKFDKAHGTPLGANRILINFEGRQHGSSCCALGPMGGGGVFDYAQKRMLWRTSRGHILSASPDGRFLLMGENGEGFDGFSIVHARNGAVLTRWKWGGSPCPQWGWRSGPKAGLAWMDYGGLSIWSEENGNHVEHVFADGMRGSGMCSTSDGARFWAGRVMDWHPAASPPASDDSVDTTFCWWSPDDRYVLFNNMGWNVYGLNGERAWERDWPSGTGGHFVVFEVAWLLGSRPIVNWLDPHGWLCLSDVPRSETVCLRLVSKASRRALVAVSADGMQDASPDQESFQGMLAAQPPLPHGFATAGASRYCPNLLADFLRGEPCQPNEAKRPDPSEAGPPSPDAASP
ncbi:MAG: hypothetical protein HY898_26470 [Deltaproteobacteria bacterium]|nr:hypothetical protein [Deltaproteobacteria bacterium]